MTAATPSRPVWLWRSLLGKPDGFFIQLRCGLLGHDWYACDPGCCNRWLCWRCETMGPSLDNKKFAQHEVRLGR